MTGTSRSFSISRYANLLVGLCLIVCAAAIWKGRKPERVKFDLTPAVSDAVPDLTGGTVERFQAQVNESITLRGRLILGNLPGAPVEASIDGAAGPGVRFSLVPVAGKFPESWSALDGKKVRVTGILGFKPGAYSVTGLSGEVEDGISHAQDSFFMGEETVRLDPETGS